MRTFVAFNSEEEIGVIGRGLIDRTLPKTVWTHAAHFAATLWLLRCRPEIDLPRAMPGYIRSYNEATGGANTDSSGYHETITQASIRAARAFLAERPAEPLFATCNALMRSSLGDQIGCSSTGLVHGCFRWRRGVFGWNRICGSCRFEQEECGVNPGGFCVPEGAGSSALEPVIFSTWGFAPCWYGARPWRFRAIAPATALAPVIRGAELRRGPCGRRGWRGGDQRRCRPPQGSRMKPA